MTVENCLLYKLTNHTIITVSMALADVCHDPYIDALRKALGGPVAKFCVLAGKETIGTAQEL